MPRGVGALRRPLQIQVQAQGAMSADRAQLEELQGRLPVLARQLQFANLGEPEARALRRSVEFLRETVKDTHRGMRTPQILAFFGWGVDDVGVPAAFIELS
eukprot:gene23313-39079_t